MNKLAALLLFLPIAAAAQVFGGVGVTGGQQTYTNWPNPDNTNLVYH